MTAKIVIAHHPYEATREDEISFQKGEVIKVTDDSDPDWWIGKKKDGALGFFPRNFVDIKDEQKEELVEGQITQVEEGQVPEEEKEEEEAEQVEEKETEEEIPAHEEKKDQVIGMARVMEDYASQGPGEISLPRGGIINVYEIIDDEWARGELNGKVGKYPLKYVEDIDMPGRPDFGRQMSGSSDTPKSPTSEEESSAPKGGFKLAAFGVKQGGIGSLFAGGGFPGLKKTGSVPKQEPRPEEKKETPSPPVASERPAPVATEAPLVSGVPNVPAFTASTEKSVEPPVKSPVQEKKLAKAIVLHPYDADNDDELSLLRGEYVEILDRHADEGWWKGRNERGEEGVFPSNFVKELEDEPVAPPTPTRARRSVNSMAKPPQVPRPASVQTTSTTRPVTLNQRPSSVQAPSVHEATALPKPFNLPSSSIKEEPVRTEEPESEDDEFEEAVEEGKVEEEKPAIKEIKEVKAEEEDKEEAEPVLGKDVEPVVPVEKEVEPMEEEPVAEKVAKPPAEKKVGSFTEKEVKPEVAKEVEPVVEEPIVEREAEFVEKEIEPAEEKEVEPATEKDIEPVVKREVEPVLESESSVKGDIEPTAEKVNEPVTEKEVEPMETQTTVTEKEITEKETEPLEPTEEKKEEVVEEETKENNEFDSMATTGPKLTAPSRVRLGGRARRSPQAVNNEPSQMEILQKEVEAAPEEEKKAPEEEKKAVSPPTKPIKPIFAKFPTPFAVGSPEEIQKPKLKPTRRLWEEKPAEEKTEKTEEEPVRPSGVKNIASRFNFNNTSGGGNEVLETKLKNHTKNEVEKVRKEFEQLLQEEKEKRLELENMVKELLERVQSLEK